LAFLINGVPKYLVFKSISVMWPSFYVATIVCHLAPLLRRARGLSGELLCIYDKRTDRRWQPRAVT
jgi:hypothetical protein